MNKNQCLDFLKLQAVAILVWVLLSACASQPSLPPTEVTQATVISFVPDKSESISAGTWSLVQKILQERFDAILSGNAEVQVVNNTLRVKLSEGKDLPIAVELATDKGEVNFVDSNKPISTSEFIPANLIAIFTDSDIESAAASNVSNMQTWIVDVVLTPEGQEKLRGYTQSHIGNYVVITQDSKVISSTIVNTAYQRGQLEIVGEFDKANANVIAAQLNSGRLPIQLVVAR